MPSNVCSNTDSLHGFGHVASLPVLLFPFPTEKNILSFPPQELLLTAVMCLPSWSALLVWSPGYGECTCKLSIRGGLACFHSHPEGNKTFYSQGAFSAAEQLSSTSAAEDSRKNPTDPSRERSSRVQAVCQGIVVKKSPGPPPKQWWSRTWLQLVMLWEGDHEQVSQNYCGWLHVLSTQFITLVVSFLRDNFL